MIPFQNREKKCFSPVWSQLMIVPSDRMLLSWQHCGFFRDMCHPHLGNPQFIMFSLLPWSLFELRILGRRMNDRNGSSMGAFDSTSKIPFNSFSYRSWRYNQTRRPWGVHAQIPQTFHGDLISCLPGRREENKTHANTSACIQNQLTKIRI